MATRQIKRNRTMAKINRDKHIVTVTRSNLNISAQVLEPKTLRPIFTSTSSKLKGNKTEQAKKVGQEIAKYLNSNKVEVISFNRNGYIYHGRIKALADAMREDKIKF
ncbi:MAG: 50S ribosomal protein L18 [Patescibacteria group bacterium]